MLAVSAGPKHPLQTGFISLSALSKHTNNPEKQDLLTAVKPTRLRPSRYRAVVQSSAIR